ncbi:MAG: dienelactone hydrolase family protein [Rhodospirillales bacterium]|nr:dienelactone hydrolase family protein [Rhodospirillales bacterium]
MGYTSLKAADGHRLSAYVTEPTQKPRAGVVVVQEIFGVNAHIRELVNKFSSLGYWAVAPALFDRAEKNVELAYDDSDIERGRALREKVGWDNPMLDIKAAVDAVRPAGKVGVVGYCWGGSLAWLAASKMVVDCSVAYYGGQIKQFKNEKPRCPVMMLFGDQDTSIPLTDVEDIKKAQPKVQVSVLPGPHGFNCNYRKSYNADSAGKALDKTLVFFKAHLG